VFQLLLSFALIRITSHVLRTQLHQSQRTQAKRVAQNLSEVLEIQRKVPSKMDQMMTLVLILMGHECAVFFALLLQYHQKEKHGNDCDIWFAMALLGFAFIFL